MQRLNRSAGASFNSRRSRAIRAAMVSSAGFVLAAPAVAQTYNYIGPTGGPWQYAPNWTLAGGSGNAVPGFNQTADLGIAGTTGTSVAFTNTSYTAAPLANLNINAANTGETFQLIQNTSTAMAVSGSEGIGGSGSAVYNQSAGTNTTVNLGLGGSTAGTYLLSGTGSLTAAVESLGYTNTNAPGSTSAYFDQSGGSNNLEFINQNTDIFYGVNVGGSYNGGGVYNMTGGTLNILDTNYGAAPVGIAVNNPNDSGNAYPATFLQSGGSINISQGTLYVGSYTDTIMGNGLYVLSGGSITGNFSEAVAYMGGNGAGTFIQTGGLQNISGGISITAIVGLYQQSGGTNIVGSGVSLGGEYDLSGGLLSVTGNLVVAGSSIAPGQLNGELNITATGQLNLSGGAVQVGYGSPGLVIQTGGTANISNLQISSGAIGTYLLIGTGNLITTSVESIGVTNAGLFQQSGGTHTAKGTVNIGTSSTGSGSYQLSNGTLNVSGTVNIGLSSTGSYIQTGGNATIANLYFGPYSGLAPGSFATGLLTGGNLSAGTLSLGYSAGDVSTFLLTGGSLTINNSCFINSGAVFNQSGGTVSGPIINSGQFIFNAGSIYGSFLNYETATFNSQVYVGGGLTNIGTITLNTGVLGTAFSATFLNEGQINISGGAIQSNGPVVNDATILVSGTLIFTGGMTNNGLLNQEGFLAIQIPGNQALTNNGTVNFYGGQTVSLAGSFNNSGSLFASSSVVTGGTIANLVGGSVNGPGVILSAFSNSGSVFPGSGTLNIAPAWNNSGTVQLTAVTSTITGGAITNSGNIMGFGVVGSSVNNSTGTIQALGGTLNLPGALTNPAGGTLAASTGNELLVSSGLATNIGLINLVGGTYDNGGHPLLNSGQITGYGVLRTGGLTNAGLFTLSGSSSVGTTTVNGNVTNNAGYFINIRYQPAIFTGNIVNNGTITTYSTSVTFAGTYTGNNYISDPSTNIFQNTVTITPGGTMTGGTGDTYWFLGGAVTNNGTFANGGTLISSDSYTNTGTFSQTGVQNWSAGAVFTNTAGSALFGTDAGAAGQNLTVNVSGGTLTFASSQHLAQLNITAGGAVQVSGGGPGHRSVIVTPIFSDTGTLDLTSDALDIQNGGSAGLATISSLIARGYNGGKWTGTGITSSSAVGDSSHLTALGVILNTTSGGTAIYSSLDGVAVATNDVLAKYTYYGDANLDGKVDGSDYSQIDSGYLNHLTGWFNGDFNYDGLVNGSDYTLIDNAYNSQGVQMTAEVASPTSQRATGLGAASLPEPAMLSALGIGIAFLPGRRSRRQR